MEFKIRLWVFWCWIKPSFSFYLIFPFHSRLPRDKSAIIFWNATFTFHFPSFPWMFPNLSNPGWFPFLSSHSRYSFVTQILCIVLYHFLICYISFALELTISSLKNLIPLYPPHGSEIGTYLMPNDLRGEKTHFLGEYNSLLVWMMPTVLRIYSNYYESWRRRSRVLFLLFLSLWRRENHSVKWIHLETNLNKSRWG